MNSLHALARANHGLSGITPDVVQPFLDIERDRNRVMTARTWAGPLGAVGMHLPLLPASQFAPEAAAGGHSMVSPAASAIEYLGMNAPVGASAGDYAATIAGHMGPILLMSGLGALGGVGLGMGAGKLISWLAKRRRAKRQQEQENTLRRAILGV